MVLVLLFMTSAPGVDSWVTLKVCAPQPSELLMLLTGKTSVANVDILSTYLDHALLSGTLVSNVGDLGTSGKCVIG